MLKLILPILFILLVKPKPWHFTPSSLIILSTMSFKLFTPNTMSYEASSMWTMDRLTIPLIILTMWMTALMYIASSPIFLNSQNQKLFSVTLISLCTILILAFATNNLVMFYIMFEASLLPTVMLIVTWGYQPERLQASTYMMIYMIAASLPLLANLTMMYHSNFQLNMFTPLSPPTQITPTLWWTSAILAFMVKLPLFTVHLWLPKAHVEAPIAGSMILAGLLLKLGGYGLMRLSLLFQPASLSITLPLSALALWGASLTGFSCLRQTDLKALIAYSSVAHMGLFLAAVISLTNFGWSGALITMLAHGLISPMLFTLANLSYQTTNTRNLFLTKGMMTLAPSLTFWWFLAAAANMSAPPSVNLMGEILMLTSVLSISTFTSIPLMILTFVTAAYSLHLFTNTQHGPLSTYITGLSMPQQSTFTLLSLHLLPALALITSPTLISLPYNL